MKSLFVFIVFAVAAHGRIAPDYIPTCKRSDPNLSKCVQDVIEKLRPQIMKGINEIKLPAFENFRLPTLKIDKDLGENFHVKIEIRDAQAKGASSFTAEDLKVTLNGKMANLNIGIRIPKLDVTAKYELKSAKILNLNLVAGSGQFKGTFTDVKAKAKGNAKIITENGHEYLDINDIDVKIRIADGHVDIKDDNENNNVAAQTATLAFNSNPSAMLTELMPIIQEVAVSTVKKIFNEVAHALPFDEILQD